MLLLTTAGQPQIEQYAHPNLGRLIQPRHYWRIEDTGRAGIPWAADNDAFGGFGDEEEARWHEMLERIRGVPGCLFAAAPDVVGDALRTTYLYEEYAPLILRYGLPCAYVAQEGLADLGGPPWGSLDALFIGGATDEFKLWEYVEGLVAEARRRGKHVHMGRVNSARRFRYAKSIGCDSVDGTQFSQWRATYLRDGLAWAAAPAQLRFGA